ncbi:unnamed protein product [Parnassius apollo]|uniref:(apollo) hypothetical protein n=1 Tax=Parnassius apollo TaxID=110799 RepID=A0A8S3X1R6_PARAO|nr:unnamed protein product [Parnassius apollo]
MSSKKGGITKKHLLLAKLVTGKKAPCVFCQRNVDDEIIYGKLYAIGDIQCHYFCVLLSCCLIQKGNDEDGLFGFLYPDIIAEVERSKKHKCSYCGRDGATLGCSVSQCRKQFHLPCGRERDAVSLFYGNYKTFCNKHAPKQKITDEIMAKVKLRSLSQRKMKQLKNQEMTKQNLLDTTTSCENENKMVQHEEQKEEMEAVCVICYETVDGYPTLRTFWPPCCARDAWFHRSCLQRMALSAGMHYLKCPLCNEKEIFYKAVLSQGYYVPDRDAAWELEQNAFSEIYERPVSCAAPECLCPMGRDHDADSGAWDIKLCVLCGSAGAHEQCRQRQDSSRYVCAVCAPVAPQDIDTLADCLETVVLQAEPQEPEVRRGVPMPSRMSLRRTKQRTLASERASSSNIERNAVANKTEKEEADSDDSVKDPDYEAQPTKHAEYSSDTAEEQNITTNYTNISDDHNLLTSNMVSINIENYEEPLSSTNEHAIVFNDPGVIENSELSAIENVSNENAASPIVYNSSPTKTGKKRRLNEANWKVNVAKRLRNSGHTQNEGDSVHPQIEREVKRQLRSGPMYTPDAFIGAIKAARNKSEPFHVNEMCFDDFFDWKSICTQMNFAIMKDEDNNTVKLAGLKMIKVQSSDPDAIFFKESYAEELFKKAIGDEIPKSDITASRLELNLKPPKKPPRGILEPLNMLKDIENILISPLKIFEQGLYERISKVGIKELKLDSNQLIEQMRQRFKKPRPLVEKKKIINDILESIFESLHKDKTKTKEPIKEWNSPKKCSDSEIETIEKILIENNNPTTEQNKVDFEGIDTNENPPIVLNKETLNLIEDNAMLVDSGDVQDIGKEIERDSERKETDNSSNSTFHLPPEFIAEESSNESLAIVDTPKKFKPVHIQKDSSMEISKNNETVNIDVVKLEETETKSDFINSLDIKSPFKANKCAFKFSPLDKEVLQSNKLDIDVECFKNHYLNEIDKDFKCTFNHQHVENEKADGKLTTAIDFAMNAYKTERKQRAAVKRKILEQEAVAKKRRRVSPKKNVHIKCNLKLKSDVRLKKLEPT